MTALLERTTVDVSEEALPPPLVYRPQPKQESWHECPAYEAGFGGAKFGGKSLGLMMEATRYTWHPRYRGVLFRRTYPRLTELMDRAFEWYPGLGAKWNGDTHTWTFPSGAKILFRHCSTEKAKREYQGHQYIFMGFDQLEEFTESQYDFLIAQNRSPVAELPSYTRSTFNPGGIGHAWVKRRFVEHGTRDCAPWVPTNDEGSPLPARCFHFATIDDNPAGEAADPTYRQRLDNLPADERRALKSGDWDVFAGQYFTEWRRDKHVISYFDVPREWATRRVSVDFGYGAPWSCHFYVRDEDLWKTQRIHRWFAYREFYGPGVRDVAQAKLIADAMDADREAAKGAPLDFVCVADPSMWNRKPQEAVSIADIYADGGVHLVPANNDRVPGWQRVRDYLADQDDGYPAVVYMETCANAIRTVPALVRDPVKVEDVDTEGEDHAADELRYFVMNVGPIERNGGTRRGALGYGFRKPGQKSTKAELFGQGVDPRLNRIDPRRSGIAFRQPAGTQPATFDALKKRLQTTRSQ